MTLNASKKIGLGLVSLRTSGSSELRDDRNRFSGSNNVSGRPGTMSCEFKIKEDGVNLDPVILNW